MKGGEKLGIRLAIRDLFTGKSTEISPEKVESDAESYVDKDKFEALVAEEFMINVAINIIANAISKCEFRTFLDGKENKGDEYYLWNYEPNVNQNSSEFIHELVYKLLYDNKALVFELAGQLLIADGFSEGDEVIKQRTFSNISRGALPVQNTKTMNNVMMFRLNNISIRMLLLNLCTGYNDLMSTAFDKFYKSGGEKGVLSIDAQKLSGELKAAGKTFDEVMEDMMNNRFKKFFNSRNAVMPLFNGYTYDSKGGQESTKKSTSELKDVLDIDDKIVAKVANAFNIPVSLLKGDVSDIDKITQNFLTFCIDPICDMIETEICRKRCGKAVLNGTYVKIDTTSILHIDLFNISESLDKLKASGLYNTDELRRKCGDSELNTDFSKQYVLTKNYEKIEEGGKNSAQS